MCDLANVEGSDYQDCHIQTDNNTKPEFIRCGSQNSKFAGLGCRSSALSSNHISFHGIIIRMIIIIIIIIDVAIPEDRNMIKKEAEKILNYKDLIIEIEHMWNVKTKVTPVITGATGTISKSFRKYLSSITGKHDIKELQKTALLGTARILRKVLM
jgi:hypothetical protein